MMDASDQSQVGSEQTPGRLLRQAREDASFSVQYIAEQLRLTESYIVWLESDQFESLPPEPFVLGYYRAYARILNHSADSIIASYHLVRQQQPDLGSAPSAPKTVRRQQEEPLNTPAVNGIGNHHYAIAVAVLLVIWVLFSSFINSDDTSSSDTEAAAELALETSVNTATTIEDTVLSESSRTEDLAADQETVTETVAANSLVEAQASQTAAFTAQEVAGQDSVNVSHNTDNSSLDQLLLHFSDECWLEVTDANDDVVAANLYQKGDEANFQGVAPFTVMLGNVRAAKVSLNGKEVQLQPRGFRTTLRAYVFADGTTQTAE